MKKIVLSILLGLFFVISGFSQTQFWSDTFEDAGAPSTGARTPSVNFSCSGPPATSYFFRTNLSGIALQSGSYTSIEGTKFWAGEDVDAGPTCANLSISQNQQVTWSGISISGKTGLSFKGLFAANSSFGSNWEGSNFAPNQDFVGVEYRIDGGAWTKAIVFYASAITSSQTLKLETTGDLIGDGADLTYVFTEYTATIPLTGTTLDLRLNCSANGSSTEEFAVDNFRLFEAPVAVAPTVTTTAATTVGAVKATLAGNVTADGGATVTDRGVVWATTVNPTTANTKVAIGTGTGVFSQLVTGLPAATLIHFRAYAINSAGTSYGADLTFTTNAALSATTAQTNVSCNGGSNGSATVTASGGVTPYTYSWAPSGGTAATASGLTANAYTCTITDSEGTQLVKNFTVTQPTALVITAASQTNISCNGGSNGAATVNVPTGGTPGYTYNWTPGNPTGDGTTSVSGLTAGTWTCTVTDANGCTAARSFTVTQPTALVVTAASQTNISCNGGSNGAAAVNVPTGGTAGYSFNWTPGNPTGDGTTSVSGLTAGTWTCTVTDANGCTASQNFTVTQPSAITSSVSSQTNVSCNGGTNGSATVSVSGGTAAYTYSWAPSGGTAATATGLGAGAYTCTITDANSCTKTQSVTITQPSAINSSIAAQTNVSCNGGTNGSATVSVSGGTAAYTYSWAPSGGTAATATGLGAGAYTCTITDANSCTKTQSVTITQPSAITSSVSSQTNVSCNGGTNGSATVSVSGGTAAYTYSWAPSGGTAATATGLGAGAYTCTITDANSCTKTQSVTITQPTAINNAVTNTSGVLTATQAGATYQWYQCPNTLLTGETNQTYTPTVTGDYKVTITVATCTVTSACVTVATLGSSDFEANAKFVIYPNPTHGILNVTSAFDIDLNIITQLGQIVKSFKVNGNTLNTINVEELSDGIYFITGANSSNIATQKLIIKN